VRISTPARNRLLVCLPRRPIDVFKASDKFVVSFHIISFLHGSRKCMAMPRKNLDLPRSRQQAPATSLRATTSWGAAAFLSAAVAPVAGDHQRRVRREKIIGPIGPATPRPHGDERVFARLETMR
jgi:hypothetical protein